MMESRLAKWVVYQASLLPQSFIISALIRQLIHIQWLRPSSLLYDLSFVAAEYFRLIPGMPRQYLRPERDINLCHYLCRRKSRF